MKSKKGIALIVFFIMIVIIIIVVVLISKYLYMKTDKMKAEYEARFHTITFDTDGGEYIPPIRVEYMFNPSDKVAKKEGYIFAGWLLDGQPIDESIQITQDITLKANYRKKEDNTNNYSSSNNKPSSNQSDNTNNSNNNKTSITQTQLEDKKTYPVNIREETRHSYLEYAVTVINYQTESHNSILGTTQSDQEFVIVNMKIENLGDEPLIISKNDFRLEDANSQRYYPATYRLESELGSTEIGVGQSKNISVRFVFLKDFSKSIVIFPNVYYGFTIKLK